MPAPRAKLVYTGSRVGVYLRRFRGRSFPALGPREEARPPGPRRGARTPTISRQGRRLEQQFTRIRPGAGARKVAGITTDLCDLTGCRDSARCRDASGRPAATTPFAWRAEKCTGNREREFRLPPKCPERGPFLIRTLRFSVGGARGHRGSLHLSVLRSHQECISRATARVRRTCRTVTRVKKHFSDRGPHDGNTHLTSSASRSTCRTAARITGAPVRRRPYPTLKSDRRPRRHRPTGTSHTSKMHFSVRRRYWSFPGPDHDVSIVTSDLKDSTVGLQKSGNDRPVRGRRAPLSRRYTPARTRGAQREQDRKRSLSGGRREVAVK